MSSPALSSVLHGVLDELPGAELRPVRDTDADGLIALVDEAYRQHPGCVLDLPGVDADLVTPATSAAEAGITLWVVTHDGSVVASVGAGPRSDDGVVELKRLYVAASHRRRGLAAGLVEQVERYALDVGASVVELWSDTRFEDAHRLYRRCGYRSTGRTRDLNDPSNTTEYHFRRSLADT